MGQIGMVFAEPVYMRNIETWSQYRNWVSWYHWNIETTVKIDRNNYGNIETQNSVVMCNQKEIIRMIYRE